ncbi:MAG: AraC family transcriptional regulator [Chitinophagaceae bacterium]
MKRLRQFEPFILSNFEVDVYPLPRHNHTYYEIIYIYYGSGKHCLNNNNFNYTEGDLFLLTPEDNHYFVVEQKTRFVFLKFTDSFFYNQRHTSPGFFDREVEPVMRNKFLREIKPSLTIPDINFLKSIIDNITAINDPSADETAAIVFYQLLSIIEMVKKALVKNGHHPQNYQQRNNEQLLSFIHQHIYTPGLIQIKTISENFNISPAYFGAYFKRNFGISYREYLNQYRINLIERRLISSKLTLKEIASEFGLVDESHLSRYFKNQKKISPRAFKQEFFRALMN